MNTVSKQQNNYRWQIIFMWLYVFAVYLPFFVFMLVTHDVYRVSMSNIAWIVGYTHHLVIYLVLTFPFCLFMLLFLNRHFIGRNKFVLIVSVAGCVLIVIGAFIPLRVYEQYAWMNLAHTYLSVGGSVVFMFAIIVALVLHAVRQRLNKMIFVLYGLFVVGLLIAFIILWTAALFQLMATMCFMLILLAVNTVSVKH